MPCEEMGRNMAHPLYRREHLVSAIALLGYHLTTTRYKKRPDRAREPTPNKVGPQRETLHKGYIHYDREGERPPIGQSGYHHRSPRS